MPGKEEVLKAIDGMKEEMLSFAREMLRIPAIAPDSGGSGEMEKAERILSLLSDWGFDSIERYDCPDERVPAGKRPNILLRIKGTDPSLPRVWTFVHMDVVPPGDLGKWTGDPFELRVDGGKLIARGVEDNGQALTASLFAARALLKGGARPRRDVNIFLVSDEEVGSGKGMVYLSREHRDLFSDRDLFLVPDAGEPDGSLIEVSEKSIMWLRIRTIGKQVHASTPHKGINANLAAMRFLVSLHDELNRKYPAQDVLYDYPRSSFVPSKREVNVPNINTIPGEDVSYIDSRILPVYDPDEVLSSIRAMAERFEKVHNVRIGVETVQYEKAAPPTSPSHPVVGLIKDAVREVYGVEATPRGIGGGTCAAILRRAGFPAAVWGRIEETAHMPDEHALIENYIGDTKVFAIVFMS